ncbi:NAD-dependent DNA ligase subunit B [Serratia phage Slocum]|nr:NAD-dependent DNA ligase subunit B [Serratia phage Slocum]URC22558.1 DNA ligase [Serratia phage vB_SmaM-Kamaji]
MKIEIPNECPSCQSKLENINGQLFCRNKTTCPAQSSKLLENFCKKLKLKGFGPATLDKLGITRISELFYMDAKALQAAVGDKVAAKLEAELNEKMRGKVKFADILASLNIPLIGQVAAEKIASKFNDLESMQAEGKAGENLSAWKNSELGADVIALPWNFSSEPSNSASSSLANDLGVTVCITGSLIDFKNRTEASTYLEQQGFTVKKDVTKAVQYLICEDETKKGSSSYKKAQTAGIPVITIKQLIDKFIGEQL